MVTIGNAIHTAVVDCTSATAAYCTKASDVVTVCRVGAADWTFDADAANCPIDNDLDPRDPLTNNPYFINSDGDHNVKVWADSDESTWDCGGTATCSSATFKRF